MTNLKNRLNKLEIRFRQEPQIAIHLIPVGYVKPTPEQLARCPYNQNQNEKETEGAYNSTVTIWLPGALCVKSGAVKKDFQLIKRTFNQGRELPN